MSRFISDAIHIHSMERQSKIVCSQSNGSIFNDIVWMTTNQLDLNDTVLFDISNGTMWRHNYNGILRNLFIHGVSKNSLFKTFWNIFTSVKSFCVIFCKFLGNSCPHISSNFCRFILIFHQMALIFTHRFHPVKFWVFTQKMIY